MSILEYQEFLINTERTLLEAAGKEQHTAIVVIDFDGLVELDGILGYSAVDVLLQKAAERVSDALGKEDMVGFTGRHQLACMLVNLPGKTFAELAGYKIARILNTPFVQSDRSFLVLSRIGVALADANSTHESLLRQANSAMNQAIRGYEPFRLYSPEFDAGILSELELLTDLDRAIEESRIFLVYQPHLELATGKIVGAEALLRWNHPQKGSVSPDSIVRIAERTGIIAKLTFWVFHTAMRQCAEYRKAGLDCGVSVNFSASNLREMDLVDIVSQGLQLWNVPPDKVVIELTETAIMDENERSLEVLRCLKDMGLRIAMDDFGTGYSSMALLQKLPFDEIKIDLFFTRFMLQKPDHEHMVAFMIGLAHKLGMRVVAEGVENLEIGMRLKEMGCDVIQGYSIGKPMAFKEFMTMALAYNARQA